MEKVTKQTKRTIDKIVFVGPESTGKTTIAKALANMYHTHWVPEYARDYLQQKYDNTGKICEIKDLITIAKGQLKSEMQMLKLANKFLFCDTNIFETYVYSKIYFPNEDFSELRKMALDQKYDYCFLTGIDVPWVADDLRDRPHNRKEIFLIFKKYLEEFNQKYTLLEGNNAKRIKTVIQTIEN